MTKKTKLGANIIELEYRTVKTKRWRLIFFKEYYEKLPTLL